MIVDSLAQNGRTLFINGGLEGKGYKFCTEDMISWYENWDNDSKAYYEVGRATLRVLANMNFYDNSDFEIEGKLLRLFPSVPSGNDFKYSESFL